MLLKKARRWGVSLHCFSSPYNLKVLLRSSYFFLYFCISTCVKRTLFSSFSMTALSSVSMIFSNVTFSSSISSKTSTFSRLACRSSSTSSYNSPNYLKLCSISPSLSSTLAIFNLTFFMVIWDESNFLAAIERELLKSRSASWYCSFISKHMPLLKKITQFIGCYYDKHAKI